MINVENESHEYQFSEKKIDCYFNTNFSLGHKANENRNIILITDEHVFAAHSKKFIPERTIILKAGEAFKNQQSVSEAIDKLIALKADRNTFILAVGGGVVTDIAGFIASVYMRGIRFGFAPTSILGMVDACMGGKNGVDVGVYKNLVGVINHPEFLLYDFKFLKTLPLEEWKSGFAEIIKHACIKDANMFAYLESKSINEFHESDNLIGKLIELNVNIKYSVVSNDERETGDRRLLNFGHTIGHAIENISGILHGYAVSIGMVTACLISEKVNNFSRDETMRIVNLLTLYGLPVAQDFDKQKTWDILLHDKKKTGTNMNYVVLDKIGKGAVVEIPLAGLKDIFFNLPEIL